MRNPESVADHSFRTAIIALALATAVGADAEATAVIALIHDLPEARTGDIHHLGRRYMDHPKPHMDIIEDQVGDLPPALATLIRKRADQWHKQSTTEAQLARDADTIESILHVVESLHDRPDLRERWITYLSRSIETSIGRRVVEAVVSTDPDLWWTTLVDEDQEEE